MNLIIDMGNTAAKVAVYKENERVSLYRVKDLNNEELRKKLAPFKIDKAIICSVRKDIDPASDLVSLRIPYLHILSSKSRLPFRIEYDTPETIGPDRLAAVAGACFAWPGSDVLIIDAGTAITYDYLSGKTYRGGNISPGMGIRFKALNKFTGRLPLVEASEIFTSPGRNTTDAIVAGVVSGIIYEINEYIRTFEKKYSQVKVVLTGGDGGFLRNKISHNVTFMPDIVVDGLNNILEYNA